MSLPRPLLQRVVRGLLVASSVALVGLIAATGLAAAADATVPAKTCPSLEIQGTVPGRTAPTFRVAAGRATTLRLSAESCQPISWRDRTVNRVSGTVGPASVSATSRLISRQFVFRIALVGPSEPGKYSVSYQLQGPSGLIAGPITVALEVYQGSTDCAELAVGKASTPVTADRTVFARVGEAIAPTITLRNCGALTWRGYKIERVGTGAGPASSVVPTTNAGRTTEMMLLLDAPKSAGATTLSYQLKGPRGSVGQPLQIKIVTSAK